MDTSAPKAPDEDVLDVIAKPAEDDMFHRFIPELDFFSSIVPHDAPSRLIAAGIEMTAGQASQFLTGLAMMGANPELQFSQSHLENWKEIQKLSARLLPHIKKEATSNRHGEVHWWNNIDPNDEEPEPLETINLSELILSLAVLEKSAAEHINTHNYGKESPSGPGSNRADRIRFFYWHALLAFWKENLGRPVQTSINPTGEPVGPLVRFFQAMTAGESVSGAAVRNWILRQKDDPPDFVVGLFLPWAPDP